MNYYDDTDDVSVEFEGDDSIATVWFDPGLTTGVCVIEVDATYLTDHKADSTWEGLSTYIRMSHHEQVGRHARIWNEPRGKAIRPQVSDSELQVAMQLAHVTPLQALEVSLVSQCQEILDTYPEATWGYEDYILKSANKSREFLAPVRIMSMLAYSEINAAELPIDCVRKPFVQGTSFKSGCDDERLKRAGLYRAGMIHANDAARHAAVFLRRCRTNPALAKEAFPVLFEG